MITTRGTVGEIRMDRPHRRNALSTVDVSVGYDMGRTAASPAG